VFISDANAAMSDEDHNATLATIFSVFGDVRATGDVEAKRLGMSLVLRVRAGGTLARRRRPVPRCEEAARS
jgi:hypothetical protein